MDYTTLCYIQTGLQDYSLEHIRHLWLIRDNNYFIFGDKTMKINVLFTTKDWIIRQAPIRQANLWNRTSPKLDCDSEPVYFKPHLKSFYMQTYIDLQTSDTQAN